MSDGKLMPCPIPWCGKPGMISMDINFVECSECSATGLIADWQKPRTAPPALVSVLEQAIQDAFDQGVVYGVDSLFTPKLPKGWPEEKRKELLKAALRAQDGEG